MTTEEAIQILDPETRREALGEIPVMERIAADQEACRIAVAALRAQRATLGGTYVSMEWFKEVTAELDALKAKQAARLDRSRWEDCMKCMFQECSTCKHVVVDPRCAPCKKCVDDSNYQPQNYCPYCGRPLTEEAWAELEERISP